MQKFRARPIVIEARQWDGNDEAMHDFCPGAASFTEGDVRYLLIETAAGMLRVEPCDWVIRRAGSEFSSLKPMSFEAAYEPV